MAEEDKQQNNSQANDAAPDDLTAKLKECEAKRDEYLNGWKRAQADFVNYKKEEARRFDETIGYAQTQIIKDVLPALDSFGFALVTVEKESPAYKGIILIQSQLLEAIKSRGVEKIPVSRGDVFNPAIHEAMMEVDTPPDSPELSGKIVEELVPGYRMSNQVIRAAKVKLAK